MMGLPITFRVNDVPPKKDGAKSMWSKPTEASRIIALRTSALAAMQAAGITSCITTRVALELSLFVRSSDLERIGDLDNFVSGVCDGLQKANASTPFDVLFYNTQYQAIHPTIALLENDAKIMTIIARKVTLQSGEDAPYYVVKITTV